MPNPYPEYNFSLATSTTSASAKPIGGFSEATGLTLSAPHVDSRHHGSSASAHHGNITLKRGIISSADFSSWLNAARASLSTAGRTAMITSYSENNAPQWARKLTNALPVRYTGPPLDVRGANEIAIEELVLSCTRIESVPPS